MKGAVTLVAVGAVLLVAGAGCGESGPAAGERIRFGHGILFVQSHVIPNVLAYAPIYLWKPGSGARLVGPHQPGVESVEWSPDGKSIVFSGTEADGFDQPTIDHVYEMRTDGTGLKWLTDDSNHNSAWVGEENPSWTPDGRGVIYFRNTLNESRSPPVLLNLGTKRKRVLRIKNLAGDPLWGLLGIAQVPGPAYRTITLFNPDTHRSRVFAHTDGPVEQLAWSRSGQAAVLEGRGSQWLAVYSRGGREVGHFPVPAAVANAHASVCGLNWSPDGKWLLVVGSAAWVTDLAGRRWRKLPLPSIYNCETSWG